MSFSQELENHPDRFTFGLSREDAEDAAARSAVLLNRWTLDQVEEWYGPIKLVSGFARPGDTVTVDGREGTYVGLSGHVIAAWTGHLVEFKDTAEVVCGPTFVSGRAEIVVVKRAPLDGSLDTPDDAKLDTEAPIALSDDPYPDDDPEVQDAKDTEPEKRDAIGALLDAAGRRIIDRLKPKDTPRKPEPGDRVRVSYEAVYERRHSDYELSDHMFHSDDNGGMYSAPGDAEVTVIEPARPAVPEDPQCDVIEVDEDGSEHPWSYSNLSRRYTWAEESMMWDHLWRESQTAQLYPVRTVTRYERGPVIGG